MSLVKSINQLVRKFKDLVHLYNECLYWLEEFYVIQNLIVNKQRKLNRDDELNMLYKNYFYTFTNNLYIFKTRLLQLLNDEKIQTKEIYEVISSPDFKTLYARYRNDYVHGGKSIYFSLSLRTHEIVVCYATPSKVELYHPEFLVNECIKACNLTNMIIYNLDKQIFDLYDGNKKQSKSEYKDHEIKVKHEIKHDGFFNKSKKVTLKLSNKKF